MFIECKYISKKVVFWFDEKDRISTQEWLTINTPLDKDNAFAEEHHYLSTNNKVAKLFSGETKPNLENEVVYKALNQSLNAMVYNRQSGSIIPERSGNYSNILITVELPVIACNSFEKFYRVEMDDQENPEVISENFQLEVNYAYSDKERNHRNEFFLIDVVSFGMLDHFLDLIEKDYKAIANSLDID